LEQTSTTASWKSWQVHAEVLFLQLPEAAPAQELRAVPHAD